MFEAAGLDVAEKTLRELSEEQMNGRQIRNMVRLAKLYYGKDKQLQMKDMEVLQEHVLRVKENW